MLLVYAVNTEGRPLEIFVKDGRIAAVGQELEALAGERCVEETGCAPAPDRQLPAAKCGAGYHGSAGDARPWLEPVS